MHPIVCPQCSSNYLIASRRSPLGMAIRCAHCNAVFVVDSTPEDPPDSAACLAPRPNPTGSGKTSAEKEPEPPS